MCGWLLDLTITHLLVPVGICFDTSPKKNKMKVEETKRRSKTRRPQHFNTVHTSFI